MKKTFILALFLMCSSPAALSSTGTVAPPEKVKPLICDMYLFSRDPVSGKNLVLLDAKNNAMRMFHFKGNKTSIESEGLILSFPEWKIDGRVKVTKKGDVLLTSFDSGNMFSLSSARNPGEVLMIGGCRQLK